ncbi:arylsulfatase [Mesorhizobium sp. WSM3860]|nr:arylsulfatase [Mesorhizobium sp. WSM3860]
MILHMFHTAPALVAVFDGLATELGAGIALKHTVREDLLKSAIECGSATPGIIAAAAEAMLAEFRLGADAVICTCSTIGAAADVANSTSHRPVLRIDRPMARESVRTGSRILVLATLGTTIAPTAALIEAEARAAGRKPDIDSVVLDRARQLFLSGNIDAYLQAVAEGIAAATLDADVVVLAQASMAAALPLVGKTEVPVLTSPRIGFIGALRDLQPGGAWGA